MKRVRTVRRSAVLAMLGLFLFSGSFGLALLVSPTAAHAAVPAPQPVIDVGNLPPNSITAVGTQLSASEDVKDGFFTLLIKGLINTSALAILNAGHYFAQRIAYDMANYIASGDKGQKPLFITEGFGEYFKQTGLDAAGEALGTVSQLGGFENLGINLCNPTSPRVALNIKLGFANLLPGLGLPVSGQPRPRCEWNQVSSNWNEFANLDSDTVLSQVGVMFTPGQSSLGAALEFNRYSFNLINERQQRAIDEAIAKSGFKDLTSKISGKVMTPAETIQAEMNRVNQKAASQGEDLMIGFTPAAFGEGAFGILPAALNTFVNTLGEKLSKRIFEKGLIALSGGGNKANNDPFSFDVDAGRGGRAAAELANANLLTPRIFTSTDIDELTEFATCAAEFKGLNNCVMDQQFFNGVQRSSQGTPVTVRQAIEQGFLNGNWRLLPQSHPRNGSRNCYREGFCYSNLIKLRRARVIPIGWELAANSPFNDVGNPVTLKEAMDRYNDCPVDSSGNIDETKLPDPLHPWCRLVDPNWVLKYPEAICRQEAPGPLLLSSAGDIRGRACVDSTSCILEGADGKCIGGYGYCMQEKTYWRMDGDSCPGYYASCQTVRRADGQTFSYLSNTTQVDVCTADNAGCREYSLIRNAVSNGGFEDLLGGGPRSWSGASGVDRTGVASMRGRNALLLNSGTTATQDIPSVLPGKEFTLSGSALAANAAASGDLVRISVSFRDRAGALTPDTAGGDQPLVSDCVLNAGENVASFDVVMTDLGYTTAGCKVTSPSDAVSAVMTVQAVGGNAFVDEVGMVGDTYSADPLDSVFLNAKTESCPADQAGCTQLVRASTGTLNFLRNPGFESASESGEALYWGMPASAYERNLFEGSEGASSVVLGPSPVTQVVEDLIPNATYSFSVFTKHDGSGVAPTGRAELFLFTTSGGPIPAAPAGSSPIPATTCTRSGGALALDLATGSAYQRSECQFTTPPDVGSLRVELTSGSAAARLLADAVQLELSVRATPFHAGYAPGAERVHLKLPPKGLNCTGSAADPAACASFAPSCRKDDVGCNRYTPKGGGNAVPAITTSGDACPAQCSGYDTFREEPTNFTDEEFPLFLIPSTAQSCTASEAGCEEFTDLATEQRKYFTSIRLCTSPDAQTDTFYTWEGSDVEGFQLRAWRLRRSNVTSPSTGGFGADPTGGVGPCTNLEYDSEGDPRCADVLAPTNIAACDRTEMLFNPDCREFYDTDGNIHYRLYSRTIVASDSCSEYRMTRSVESECRTHGGLWTGTECHYFGLESESRTCRAAASGCRAYTGNASRNVRVVMNDTFESGTTDGWTRAPGGGPSSDVSNSNESVTAGGHSLRSSAPEVNKDVSSLVRRGRSYLLTFWAKGNGDLAVGFSSAGDQPFTYDRINDVDSPALLTTEWNLYTVGPVNVVADPAEDPSDPSANEQLVFASTGSLFFVDNVELREVAESVYLIQDSWNTPAVCDETPQGDAAPQFMLGCKTYTDKDNLEVNLKSFSRLCSDTAIGCEAFYDTRNSASPFGASSNAVCSLASTCPAGSVNCGCVVDGQTVCQVPQGGTSCQYDSDEAVEPTLAPAGHLAAEGDTAVVGNDVLVYAINDSRFRCDATNAGCSAVGLRTFNQDGDVITAWETRHVKVAPERFNDILCTEEENFCQAYTRRIDNAPLFFKDPGNHVCEYRQNVLYDGFTYSGWFKKGLDEPCYADFLEAGSLFGIWKNSDSAYEGWVGECHPQFDQCKEFIDPLDTSKSHPEGQPYYFILNDRLDTTSCQNRVSLITSPRSASDASACVLFDRTDDLVKRYDAQATYDASDEENGALVSAVSSVSNDTNIVIRVKRDRRCGQWLDCRSSETVFNASTGEFQNVCTAYGVCERFETIGDSTQCVSYVQGDFTGELIDLESYQKREVGHDGADYSGYAVPNRYPVHELVTLDISPDPADPDLRLVFTAGPCASGAAYGSACGQENSRGNRGTCLGSSSPRTCAYAIDGSPSLGASDNLDLEVWKNRYPATSCRAYPQEDSPFPSTVADPTGWDATAAGNNNGNPVLVGRSPAFAGANICQRRVDPATGKEYSTCECSYQLAEYGGNINQRYFSIEDGNIPSGYCEGGSYAGYECDPSAIGRRTDSNLSCCSQSFGADEGFFASGCPSGATCRALSKVDNVVGYEGQCLERDLATPVNGRFDQFACATWRPVGIVGGSRDIYNLNQTAGYFAPRDRRFYCAAPHDVNGDGRLNDDDQWEIELTINTSGGPDAQPTNQLFGPGRVENGLNQARSGGYDCEGGASDETLIPGPWCVWPGHSERETIQVTDQDGNVVQTESGPMIIQKPAIGILGCYEVADDGRTDSTYIDYPYIGPPIYRDQLASFIVGASRGLTSAERSSTNPNQNVSENCNDENDDSLIPGTLIECSAGDANCRCLTGSYCYRTDIIPGRDFVLNEENNFNVEYSVGAGSLRFTLNFDANDRLTSFRVGAADDNDEGAFGIRSLTFKFRQGCGLVAQVDEPGEFGLTKAFTEYLNPYGNYTGGLPSGSRFEDACVPWGAVGAVTFPPSNAPWTYITDRVAAEERGQCFDDGYRRAFVYDHYRDNVIGSNPSPLGTIRTFFRQIFGIWDYQELFNENTSESQSAQYRTLAASALYDDTTSVNSSGSAFVTMGGGPRNLTGGAAYHAPRVASISSADCGQGGVCPVETVGGITLNGKSEGLVMSQDGSLRATAKFYGWASHNAMPILERTMIWGDFSPAEPPGRGWYKNQKPYCSAGSQTGPASAVGECSGAANDGLTCLNDDDCPGSSCNTNEDNHFGNTPGACSARPFEFQHVFTCSLADLNAIGNNVCDTPENVSPTNAPCRRNIDPDGSGPQAASPVCVYRPAVQIKDNWGWCNCTGSDCPVPGGIHEDGGGCELDASDPDALPWTWFDGEVRVFPRVEDAQAFTPPSGGGPGGGFFPGFNFPAFFSFF